jgi:nitrate reductase gamma subunit
VSAVLVLVVVGAPRLTNPVKRFLSGFQDYLAWLLTFLPLASGYLAFHHLLIDYTLALALHILSVELLLVALPFTKLFHTVSVFVSRWYNGDIFGRKGVAS